MAHKTLVEGTAYNINKGQTLIDGTSYSLNAGQTLIGGTSYGINFSRPVQVTITTRSPATNNWGYVLINGKKQTDGTFELEKGSTITLVAAGSASTTAKIRIIDGNVSEIVKKKEYASIGEIRYDYTLKGNCSIVINRQSGYGSWADVTLTTQ